jgi:hypothetical protein
LFSVSLAASQALANTDSKAAAAVDENGWSPIWLGTEKPTKGDAYLPDGLTAAMFDLSEDDVAVVEVSDIVRDIATEDFEDVSEPTASALNSNPLPAKSDAQTETTHTGVYPPPNVVIRANDDRQPASVKNSKKNSKSSKKPASKAASKSAIRGGLQKVNLAKSKTVSAMSTTSMASEAQARWPSSASEGFEFRVRNKAQVSSMWVMKRANTFDVVYATNGGSRVSLSIPPDQFYALTNAASELKSTTATTEKCRDSFVQVHVVSSGSGRAVASCLEAKGKDADKLRLLGATLSSFVR